MRWTDFLATLSAEDAASLSEDLSAACASLARVAGTLCEDTDPRAALAEAEAAFTAAMARLPLTPLPSAEWEAQGATGNGCRILVFHVHTAVHQAQLGIEALLRNDTIEEVATAVRSALAAIRKARNA